MPNRLAGQTSPYLLQHANNPVAWHPWGPEAIAEARERNVPIFLSIGYSTCYWCHVMERESFEDAEIGEQMSRDFVCIKVDREERPDLDDAYMAAAQIMTGRGGWPMSVFIEPTELKPFWCGTYFPKVAKPGMGIPTFPTVLESIAGAWRDQHNEVMAQAQQLGDAVRDHLG
ncbi:MAG: thioredoxin domain-containing protein, partial [Planctomycetota bacterium]